MMQFVYTPLHVCKSNYIFAQYDLITPCIVYIYTYTYKSICKNMFRLVLYSMYTTMHNMLDKNEENWGLIVSR